MCIRIGKAKNRSVRGRIKNMKCRLCGQRDEAINHIIIRECSKLAKKEYKGMHDWLGQVINWKLCKRLNFDHRHVVDGLFKETVITIILL